MTCKQVSRTRCRSLTELQQGKQIGQLLDLRQGAGKLCPAACAKTLMPKRLKRDIQGMWLQSGYWCPCLGIPSSGALAFSQGKNVLQGFDRPQQHLHDMLLQGQCKGQLLQCLLGQGRGSGENNRGCKLTSAL